MKNLPLGIRLNNPGNIEWGSPWQGLVPREQSRYHLNGSPQQKRFCEFKEPADGIRAIARTLITYYDKRQAQDGSKIDTVREVIERWAPAFENDVRAYSSNVARIIGVSPTDVLDFRDYDTMRGLVVGIIAHENAGYRYPEEVVTEGLRRAGFVQHKKRPSVEVVAGSAMPALAGMATLVEPLAASVEQQQENLASGSTVRVLLGLILVGAALLVAYSQWRKHQAGAS